MLAQELEVGLQGPDRVCRSWTKLPIERVRSVITVRGPRAGSPAAGTAPAQRSSAQTRVAVRPSISGEHGVRPRPAPGCAGGCPRCDQDGRKTRAGVGLQVGDQLDTAGGRQVVVDQQQVRRCSSASSKALSASPTWVTFSFSCFRKATRAAILAVGCRHQRFELLNGDDLAACGGVAAAAAVACAPPTLSAAIPSRQWPDLACVVLATVFADVSATCLRIGTSRRQPRSPHRSRRRADRRDRIRPGTSNGGSSSLRPKPSASIQEATDRVVHRTGCPGHEAKTSPV